MSEFYGYDHDFVAFEWDNDTGGLGNAPFSVVDSSSSTTTHSRFKFGFSFQANKYIIQYKKVCGTLRIIPRLVFCFYYRSVYSNLSYY